MSTPPFIVIQDGRVTNALDIPVYDLDVFNGDGLHTADQVLDIATVSADIYTNGHDNDPDLNGVAGKAVEVLAAYHVDFVLTGSLKWTSIEAIREITKLRDRVDGFGETRFDQTHERLLCVIETKYRELGRRPTNASVVTPAGDS